MPPDTLYALSSGQPPAAVAIVRISGPLALQVVQALTGRPVAPRRPSLRELRHEGELLDRALILFFNAPGTATGEDVAELHLHGGRAVVAAVLRALSRIPGLRHAEPGEFTRRAFANGRIDLAEAEGLADLLAAETEGQRRSALQLASGALSRQIANWTGRVLGLAAAIEAQLDFSDEGDVAASLAESWYEERRSLLTEIDEFIARPPAERMRDGIKVVIAGPPNSGKSTLLNAMVGRDAAITSDIAGTTRDLIEVPVAICGIPFLLVDSAGLRESRDHVEQIGVGRARSAVDVADLVLWLGLPAERPQRPNVIVVAAKADLHAPRDEANLSVSAVVGTGMDLLVELLVKEAQRLLPPEGEVAINARQRAALLDVSLHLAAAEDEQDLLLAAEELRQARAALDRITGRSGVEDMLNALFGRFCIGK